MGAAYLADLAVGYWKDKEEVLVNWSADREFVPQMDDEQREEELAGWTQAVNAVRGWAKEN